LSVNFPEAEFDERPYQQMVLEKTAHTHHVSYEVDEKMFLSYLDDIWKAMDQPSIDGVNSYFVSKCANENGLKAVLSGLGADEYFGGYQSFSRIALLPALRILPFKSWWGRLMGLIQPSFDRLTYLQLEGAVGDYLFLRGLHTPDTIARLLGMDKKKVFHILKKVTVQVPPALTSGQYASFLESEIYMSNQLLKDTDCMSMWHALEVRVPFLDQPLLELTKTISPAIRFKKTSPKYLLTESFKTILPHSIVFRKKQGFTFPFKIWFRNNLSFFKQSVEPHGESNRIFSEFDSGKMHWTKPWSLLVMKQFESKLLSTLKKGQ
ncbi:MAG TPA: asparagine synthase C-terminal domain-containing protein, partial [Cyclobacteriaceae bacterium]